MPKTIYDRVQGFIHAMEEGAGLVILKAVTVGAAFAALALYFNLTQISGFSSPEGMESAHLARQLSRGRGYTTESIRPLVLGLLQNADTNKSAQVLTQPVPDLSNAPGYPILLAGMMKLLPLKYSALRDRNKQFPPEMWIRAFNELLFFISALALFQVARRLFDPAVAWISAIIFCGTGLYWQFSLEALPTLWLILVFLLIVLCLMALEERERRDPPPGPGRSYALAAAIGLLAGMGGLSLYSFGWLMIPILIFLGAFLTRARGRLMAAAAAAFLLVMAPWITRNLVLSHTCFGTAGYAIMQNTPHLENDTLERSFNPSSAYSSRQDMLNKILVNGEDILKNALPGLGGNWTCAFFLCGLLLPFRSLALRRFRLWLVWSLLLMAVIQACCQTHLTADKPQINSENLLAILSPLVLVFGVGVFSTLVDPVLPPDPTARRTVSGLFVLLMCTPFLLNLMASPDYQPYSPYRPAAVEWTASMMAPDELMISDIPWAVAWYGDRPCAWLPLNDDTGFKQLNALAPVHAIYLTERTSDKRFLSQMIANQHDNPSDWSYFYLDSLPGWGHGEVPSGFPLLEAFTNFPPDQMFISDRIRWGKRGTK